MEDLLISTLESLGYPVRLQGSLLPSEAYPDTFFTWWNDSSSGDSFYSNDEHAIVYAYSVNIYSTDPALVYSKLLEAKAALKAQGFIVSGAGYSVMSDEQTHTGRGITALFKNTEVK